MSLFHSQNSDDPHASTFEDLAHGPSGGTRTQWGAGMLVAALPIGYGVMGMLRRSTYLPGRHGGIDLMGAGAVWLAVSYIALGMFIHFHYFWGLSDRLCRFSQAGKLVSLFVFLPCFLYALAWALRS